MRQSTKLSFVFCHGWGFNPKFWQPLQAHLKGMDCHVLDLGYDDNYIDLMTFQLPPTEIKYIGVGHSLGLIKLLNLPLNYRALIGLQSFINFLGFESDLHLKRHLAWEKMCKNFQVHPQATLDHFYRTCAHSVEDQKRPALQLTLPNFQTLEQDLTELSQEHPIPFNIPLLILGTTQDKVVPPALIYDNFASAKNVLMDFYQLEGHRLGYDHSTVVAKKILDFVDHAS